MKDEIEREHRAHHLGRDVGEQAGEPEEDHGAADAEV